MCRKRWLSSWGDTIRLTPDARRYVSSCETNGTMSNVEPAPSSEKRQRHPNAAFQTFATVIVIGIGSLVLCVLFLAPHVEPAREEIRYSQARYDCRQLTSELQAESPLVRIGGRKEVQRLDGQTVVIELAKTDTWDTPYRVVLNGPEYQVVRVFSCGQDQVSLSAGLDFDDMSLDLAETYLDRVRHQRRQQWFITLAAWLTTWAFFGWLWMVRDRRGRRQ